MAKGKASNEVYEVISSKIRTGEWAPGYKLPSEPTLADAVQNTDAYESEASDLNGTASEPSLGIPGIFRVPAFQQGKCVS